MAERRKMGLCYNCDEPYARGHKCARLFYLEASDYIIEEPDDVADDIADETPLTPAPFDPETPMISLSAITGIRAQETMQLRVVCAGQEFTALLDSGSTHNFISELAARRAGVRFLDSAGAHVVVANGDRVACRGFAREVPIQIGKESFAVDCFSIPLTDYDMVLGIAWLHTLGTILWDFDGLTMQFTHRGHKVLWSGVGPQRPAPSSRLYSGTTVAAKGFEPKLLERLLESYADVC